MRVFGLLLMLGGLVWAVVAFNMPTTVDSSWPGIGGAIGTDLPGQVFNLDLAERRRTHLWLSGAVELIGVVLLSVGTLARTRTVSEGETLGSMRQCPHCAEDIRAAAIVCKHCGRDVDPLAPPSPELEPSETLIEAIQRGSWASVRRQLEAGADPNSSTAEGQTALDVARHKGDKMIVDLLVSKGAKPAP
jgi:hypothetical protein